MKIWSLLIALFTTAAAAVDIAKVGNPAAPFSLKTDKGALFSLSDRKGKWTVLYFYPKDETPGCTKQACAFRDSIAVIRAQGAEVYGISKDDVESHQHFIAKHQLNFSLLADPDGKVIEAYGAKGMFGFAKRWTFIIGPDLTLRWKQTDVDPAMNAKEVTNVLRELQKVGK
jgi:thioredoxin-dependent peroxiredoxin